ncbi:hypothetical protein KKH56_01270 [bacterium]|nr:hypothetical protein [bacterium]
MRPLSSGGWSHFQFSRANPLFPLRDISCKDLRDAKKDDKSLAPLRLSERIKNFAQSAHSKAEEMHYHRPKTESTQFLEKLKS